MLKPLRSNPVLKTKLAVSVLCLTAQSVVVHAYGYNSIAESNVFSSDSLFSSPTDEPVAPVVKAESQPTQVGVPDNTPASMITPKIVVASPAEVDPKPVVVAPVGSANEKDTIVAKPEIKMEVQPQVSVVDTAKIVTVPSIKAETSVEPIKAVPVAEPKAQPVTASTNPSIASVDEAQVIEQRVSALGASLSSLSQHDAEAQHVSGLTIFSSPTPGLAVSATQIDNGKKLIATILKKKLLKTEFETDIQFKDRIGSDSSKFSYFVTDNLSDGLKYDPEKQRFVVHQWVVTTRSSEPNAYFKMPLIEVPQRVDGCIGYVGDVQSGKFGGSITPELHVFIKSEAPNRSLRMEDEPYIVGEYAIDAKTAKLDKDYLKLLFIGNADIANLSFGYKRTNPNMENTPYISNVQYQIPFQLAGVYLYNAKTKHILAPLNIRDEHYSPLQK